MVMNKVLMMMVSCLAALAFHGAATAHDFWVQPSTFTPKAGDLVQLHINVGHCDQPEAFPRNSQRIERFVLVNADSEVDVPGQDGKDPVGFVRPEKDGLHIVVYDSNHARSDLEPTKFESYLREEGLESIIAQRAKRGESSKNGVEIYSRCAKSLISVGGEATGSDRALGLKLELIAGVNPATLKPGDELPLTLLFDGKPVEGVKVAAKNVKNPTGAAIARTNKDGKVRLKLADAGAWLITAVHMVPAPKDANADWESLWASLTFEAGKASKP